MLYAVSDPIEAHVNGMGLLLFDRVIGAVELLVHIGVGGRGCPISSGVVCSRAASLALTKCLPISASLAAETTILSMPVVL